MGAIGRLLAAMLLGLFGFAIAFALVVGFELAALFAFGLFTGAEIQPRGPGWIVAPLAAGVAGFGAGRSLVGPGALSSKRPSRRDRARARQLQLDEVREREKSRALVASMVARSLGKGAQRRNEQPNSARSDSSVTPILPGPAHSEISIEDTLRFIAASWDEHLKLQLSRQEVKLNVEVPRFLAVLLPDLFEEFPPLRHAPDGRLLLLLVTGIALIDSHPRNEIEAECRTGLAMLF